MHKESYRLKCPSSLRRLALIAGLVAAVLQVSACSAPRAVSSPLASPVEVESSGLVLIGFAQAPASQARLDEEQLTFDLAALLAGTGDTRVTSSRTVRSTIGHGPYDELMATYSSYGQFSSAQTQRLMAANLPANRAMVVRLESDTIEQLPPVSEEVFDAQGRRLANRARIVYASRRTTELSARLYDLRSGHVVWQKQYRVKPETYSTVSRRIGENFGSSLAASLGNTIVLGASVNEYPRAAPLRGSLLTLFQEIAYTMPVD